jgi:hypothetical protein
MRIGSCLENNTPISILTRSSVTTRMLPKLPMIMTTPIPSTTAPKLPTATYADPPGLILGVETVDTYTYIFDTVWQLILDLHTKYPQHPMFGQTEKGCLRAPLFTKKTGVGQTSWHARVKFLASSVRDSMGPTMTKGSCWTTPTPTTKIETQFSKDAKRVTLISFRFTRWLCFLANPTSTNWDILTGQKRGLGIEPRDHPFCHTCHNGEGSIGFRHTTSGTTSRKSCINGVEHGHFGTVKSNEKMKACKGRSRAKCPGHGSPPIYCFYVHGNGRPKACLNLEVTPLSCSCELKCF